jgi:type VI protein secretion system component VasK
MRILGIAGLVLALAIVGYLVVSYLHEGTKIRETLQGVPEASGTSQAGAPVDLTKRGLEQRLAPTLDQERQRVEQTNKAASQ